MGDEPLKSVHELLPAIRTLQDRIRDAVVEACEQSATEDLASIAHEEEGDTIYAGDRVSEELIIDYFEREIAPHTAVGLIAEGLRGGQARLPRGTPEESAVGRLIVHPLD